MSVFNVLTNDDERLEYMWKFIEKMDLGEKFLKFVEDEYKNKLAIQLEQMIKDANNSYQFKLKFMNQMKETE